MKLITAGTIARWSRQWPDAAAPLATWRHIVQHATWTSAHEVCRTRPNTSDVGNNRLVFRLGGGDFRLVVRYNFSNGCQVFWLHWFGTHADYDRIDPATVPPRLLR